MALELSRSALPDEKREVLREDNAMTVRTEMRRGMRRYVIDIRYTNSVGTRARYRHDAEVQTQLAARAEDQRRMMLVATTGLPFLPPSEPAKSSAGGVETKTPTFNEAAMSFLDLHGSTRLKPSTTRSYRDVLKARLTPHIGHLSVDQITPIVIRELDGKLVARRLKASSRSQVQCLIRSTLRHAKEAGFLESLPEFPRLPKPGVTIQHALTSEDVTRILLATPAPHRLALEIAAYTGLRAGEVRGLKWGDVDLERGIIVVRRSRSYGIEAAPKSGHERAVPIHPRLRSLLSNSAKRPKQAYVTGPSGGEPWGQNAVRHAFQSACKRIGLEGFRLHDLRHAFVTELFRSGASAPVVQKLAGHQHLTTTQRYAHTVLPDLTAAVSRLSW